jgi:apolipoprotein N-acyltransferase
MSIGIDAAEATPRRELALAAVEDKAPRHVSSLVVGLTGFGGILLAAAYAQQPIWWAAWLAPGALLAAVLLAGSRRRLIASAAGLIGGATSLGYYAAVSDSWPIAMGIVAARALLWTWLILVAARAAERWHTGVAVFVLPVLLAAAETLITCFSPHGAAGSYAYSQMDVLALIQIASVAGTAGIVAVVMLGGSAIGLVFAHCLGWSGRGGAVLPAALAAITVSIVFAFGLLRLSGAPAQAEGPEVALIARNMLRGDAGVLAPFWDAYGPVLDRQVQPGRIVVLPEALRTLPKAAADEAAGALARLAHARGATIVAGFIVDQGGIRTNRAVVASADGMIAWYDKQHLVPATEGAISPGRMPLLIDVQGVRAGIAICKDMHFASLGRDYGARGARLMIVPASDFGTDAWMASRMTALRGVENGYAIARSARQGLMTVSDRYGRILAEGASEPEVTTLVARLPAASDEAPTMFARYGGVTDWLWVGFAALLLWQLRRSGSNFPADRK